MLEKINEAVKRAIRENKFVSRLNEEEEQDRIKTMIFTSISENERGIEATFEADGVLYWVDLSDMPDFDAQEMGSNYSNDVLNRDFGNIIEILEEQEDVHFVSLCQEHLLEERFKEISPILNEQVVKIDKDVNGNFITLTFSYGQTIAL